MSDRTMATCDGCGESVAGALARTVRLTVDGSEIDVQRQCPDCFANWIDRYEDEFRSTHEPVEESESDIIID